MWSGPRNISTTLMYSFAQRSDTEVVDEPLYAHYLARLPEVEHPGRDEILATHDADAERVIADLISGGNTPVRFFKNMAHHLEPFDDWDFLAAFRNVLLTRHPQSVIRSFTRQVANPQIRDLGYQHQAEILDWMITNRQDPIVVESSILLADPPGILAELCARLGIGWDPAMLSWPAGPRPEDGVWAKFWYHNVHTSTGFEAPRPRRPLDDRLQPLLDEAMPFYESLRRYAIGS